MKRKLFTLLLAFMALSTYQASAAKAWVHAGDSVRERVRYPQTIGAVANQNSKLTYAGDGVFKYVHGAAPGYAAEDKIDVANPAANYLNFTAADGKTLDLTYGGVTYNRYVPFTDEGPGITIHYNPIDGAYGYLAVQTGASATDNDLLLVVHDKGGNLFLKKYSEYIADIATPTSGHLYPLWIKIESVSGRWATAADFRDPAQSYIEIYSKAIDNSVKAYEAIPTKDNNLPASSKSWSVFSVNQVDYVNDATYSGGASASGLNLAGSSTYPTSWSSNLGTQKATSYGDVIPLFTFASPEDSCLVLSVSRQNKLVTQSELDGGYANKLEVRKYGTYYEYTGTSFGTYTRRDAYTYGTAPADSLAKYTSLQKFAIWINDDGSYTLYPAASYFWKYGETKEPQRANILPNSVLLYNDRNIEFVAGATGAQPNQAWGTQIARWNGKLTSGSIAATAPYLGTAPNKVQTNSDYSKEVDNWFKFTPKTRINDIAEQRYYFIRVFPNLDDYPTAHQPNYQKKADTEYVLSTQFVDGSLTTSTSDEKQLFIVPKEKLRTYNNGTSYSYAQLKAYKDKKLTDTPDPYLRDYWSNNPYDSVNMAAHWAFIKQYNAANELIGYVIVNELGDTLQYNDYSTSALTEFPLAGGYLTQNEIATTEVLSKYLPSKWYAANGVTVAASTLNVWSTYQLKDGHKYFAQNPAVSADAFFLRLNSPTLDITLDETSTIVSKTTEKYQNYGKWLTSTYTPDPATSTWGYGPYRANKDSLTTAGVIRTDRWFDGRYLQKYTALRYDDYLEVKAIANPKCHGLIAQLEEIYYVPTFADSYTGELSNGVINTNDPQYKDGSVKQDSLSAFLLLDSNYDLLEAPAVGNGLFLGSEVNEYGIDVARLYEKAEANRLSIIPVEKTNHQAQVQEAIDAQWGAGSAVNSGDYLYGDTYKWSIIKYGNKYLVFDTIAPTATDNKLKLGFSFQNTIEANATPVRFYQPLVGDKADNNFLIYFYIPEYTYEYIRGTGYRIVATTGTNNVNVYPAYDEKTYYGNDINPVLTGGQPAYGVLSQHSNYILATVDKSKATRFTYNFHVRTVDCNEVFIAPDWLAANKLLGLPLSNTIWERAELPNAAAIGINTIGEAIVSTTTKPAATELKFQYVGKIAQRSGTTGPGYLTSANVVNNNGTLTGTAPDTIFAPNTALGAAAEFVGDLDVPLYFVRNSDGKYLTVSTTTDQYNTSATVPDVTGVKLIWADLYPRYNATTDAYDRRALQTFAISGCNGDAVKCGIDNADEWGKFIFLPLASYKINYSAATAAEAVLTDEIFYNVQLGAGVPSQNDVTKAFRIGQYVKTGGDVQNLVVVNASAEQLTSNVAVEFKVSKKNYDKLDCHHYLAYDNRAATKGYIKFNGVDRLTKANDNTIIAHWRPIQNADDDVLYSFSPELADAAYGVYGTQISKTATGKYQWDQLAGSYYFKNLGADGDGIKYHVYDFSSFSAATSSWQVVEYDLTLTCTEHALPFLDLKKYFDIDAQKLAILEDAYADRNLTYKITGDATTPHDVYYRAHVDDSKNIRGFEAFIAKLGEQFNVEAEYLNVYKENERLLTDVKKGEGVETTQHLIPYYSFGLEASDGKEYFLNVFSNGVDSVAWTYLTDAEKTKLRNYIDFPEYLPTFKFCLPYRVDANGDKVAEVAFGEAGIKYPPVYLQTLDLKIDDYPYLVVAGASTKYVTAVNLYNALSGANAEAKSLGWNIYSVDYSKIDRLQVTGWIFGGPTPTGNEWVPLLGDAGVAATVDGVLTDYKLGGGGATFITESKETPNYGVITGLKNAEALHFVFEGDTTIGDWALRPIWYYKIQIPGQEKYLTDAVNASIAKYPFNGNNYDLGYFTGKLDDNATYKAEGINADTNFDQTFGFKYVTDKTLIGGKDAQAADVQAFYVVSHANYRGTDPKEVHYRYLAEVNNHLVFVDKKSDALIFQYGKKDAAGDYTGIEVVGQSGIYGVNGGVKILGGTGKVDLYTIDGRLIKSTVISGADQTVTAPKGVVIVKNGSKVAKVVVK